MTITFENDNNVIVYAFEKTISHPRKTQQIFLAQCVWWLASIVGLESGLVNYINILRKREEVLSQDQLSEEVHRVPDQDQHCQQIRPDQLPQVSRGEGVSTVPSDLTEDQRRDRILESTERVIQESLQDRTIAQQGREEERRVNPLPTTKTELKKARKIKRHQEEETKREAERSERLRNIRAMVIRNISKD
jgi:hypothetical protein